MIRSKPITVRIRIQTQSLRFEWRLFFKFHFGSSAAQTGSFRWAQFSLIIFHFIGDIFPFWHKKFEPIFGVCFLYNAATYEYGERRVYFFTSGNTNEMFCVWDYSFYYFWEVHICRDAEERMFCAFMWVAIDSKAIRIVSSEHATRWTLLVLMYLVITADWCRFTYDVPRTVRQTGTHKDTYYIIQLKVMAFANFGWKDFRIRFFFLLQELHAARCSLFRPHM